MTTPDDLKNQDEESCPVCAAYKLDGFLNPCPRHREQRLANAYTVDADKTSNEYTFSSHPDPETLNEMFSTFEEAKAAGKIKYRYKNPDGEEGTEEFYVLEVRKMEPCKSHGDALVDDLIERLGEDEAHWGDDDYPFSDTNKWKAPLKELEEQFDCIIIAWFAKHNATREFRSYETINTTKIDAEVIGFEGAQP